MITAKEIKQQYSFDDFDSKQIAQLIEREVAAAVSAEREAILRKADELEFSPAKWSNLLEFISGTKATE